MPARRWRVLALAAAPVAGCASLPSLAGPLPVRGQHPGQLLAAHLDPTPARVLPAGEAFVRVDVAHSSLWLSGREGSNSFRMDGENTRAALDVRFGVGAGVEIEAELPFGYASGGFLDSFVIDWHDTFGLSDQGRTEVPRNRVAIDSEYQGRRAFEVEPHEVNLHDLPIGVKVRLLEGSSWALAARALVELPTGDADAGFGNGGTDVALGLTGELRLGDLELFAHGHYAFVADGGPARRAGLELRDVAAGGVGAVLHAAPGLSLHVQTQVESSVLRALGFDRVADVQWQLWTGVRFACSERTFVELALGEDLGPYVAPDFTLWAAIGTRFGPADGR